jgi:hypothetical protein
LKYGENTEGITLLNEVRRKVIIVEAAKYKSTSLLFLDLNKIKSEVTIVRTMFAPITKYFNFPFNN